MAKNDFKVTTEPAIEDAQKDGLTIDGARLDACQSAVWEIDALARLLATIVPNVDGAQEAHFVTRSIAGRLLRLSSVLMSGLEKWGMPTDELRDIVYLTGSKQG